MTTGSALDESSLRLVRKGVRVSLGGSVGTVTKANGPRAWVRWDTPGARCSYEHCDQLLVVDPEKPTEKITP